MEEYNGFKQRSGARWYDLFSRGARDWLRHNEKVREAVRKNLPGLVAGIDVLGGDGNRRVQVPVKFLEHYRFRLRHERQREGVGQGDVKPGDALKHDTVEGKAGKKGASGEGDGGVEFVLELKVDEIVDWLWEELQLPNLRMKTGTLEDDDYTREGWDRRGVRSRLDRRRSVKEAIKRRAIQPEGPAFTDDDLRYRQLVKRKQPAIQAAVFFVLDVSSSMTESERKLAKTFFFWVVQGLRRQYRYIEPVFIAHTINSWEFDESEFFKVTGQGGTVVSSALNRVEDIIDKRFDPTRYNLYLFYASDGENFGEDHEPALACLDRLGEIMNFMGFIETTASSRGPLESETALLFKKIEARQKPVAAYTLSEEKHLWDAIRAFFQHQAVEENV